MLIDFYASVEARKHDGTSIASGLAVSANSEDDIVDEVVKWCQERGIALATLVFTSVFTIFQYAGARHTHASEPVPLYAVRIGQWRSDVRHLPAQAA